MSNNQSQKTVLELYKPIRVQFTCNQPISLFIWLTNHKAVCLTSSLSICLNSNIALIWSTWSFSGLNCPSDSILTLPSSHLTMLLRWLVSQGGNTWPIRRQISNTINQSGSVLPWSHSHCSTDSLYVLQSSCCWPSLCQLLLHIYCTTRRISDK